jgi:hypothetical protein
VGGWGVVSRFERSEGKGEVVWAEVRFSSLSFRFSRSGVREMDTDSSGVLTGGTRCSQRDRNERVQCQAECVFPLLLFLSFVASTDFPLFPSCLVRSLTRAVKDAIFGEKKVV